MEDTVVFQTQNYLILINDNLLLESHFRRETANENKQLNSGPSQAFFTGIFATKNVFLMHMVRYWTAKKPVHVKKNPK